MTNETPNAQDELLLHNVSEVSSNSDELKKKNKHKKKDNKIEIKKVKKWFGKHMNLNKKSNAS